jgi:hypothetical protein
VIQILGTSDEALHLLGTQDHGQSIPALRIGQVFVDVPSPQHVTIEEPERADVRDDGLDRHPAFVDEADVILPDRVRAQAIEASTGLAAKVLDDADVTANGDRGVLASNELVVEMLQQLGHRKYLLRPTLLLYASPGCPSAAALAASFQSRRVHRSNCSSQASE